MLIPVESIFYNIGFHNKRETEGSFVHTFLLFCIERTVNKAYEMAYWSSVRQYASSCQILPNRCGDIAIF